MKKSGNFKKFCLENLEKSGKNTPTKFGQPCKYIKFNDKFFLDELFKSDARWDGKKDFFIYGLKIGKIVVVPLFDQFLCMY